MNINIFVSKLFFIVSVCATHLSGSTCHLWRGCSEQEVNLSPESGSSCCGASRQRFSSVMRKPASVRVNSWPGCHEARQLSNRAGPEVWDWEP